VKEVKSLAKYLRFVIGLDSETLPRVQLSKAFLERFNEIVVRRHGTKLF